MTKSSIFMKKRIAKVFILLAGAIFFLVLRVGFIQFVRGSELQQKALENRLREVPVEAKRGVIYDSNMKELAVSISADSVGAFPPQIKKSGKAKDIANQLAGILGMNSDDVLKKITQDSSFVWVKRKIRDFEEGQKIRDLNLEGIEIFEESQRFYPDDTLACHVLGFAGIDNQGLEGIEVAYDKELSGVPGSIVIEFDAAGRELPQAVHRYIPPQNGNSIVLTIDETLQYVVERELDQIMNSSTNPKSATIVLMRPQTGEILALGCRPDFDPNNYGDFPPKTWRDTAVSDSYEPGSTFKMITAASGLEEGVINDEETFYDPGYLKVGKETIHCWSNVPHGAQDFAEALKNSCNPVLATVGLRLWAKDKGLFYKYIRAFGFGSPTGIELPGEAQGMMIPDDQLKEINIATISIGQGIAVTPIQLITACSAIANGGNLISPQLVKEIVDDKGNIVEKVAPPQPKRVISEATSKKLCQLLEGVVSDGTGSRAYIPGYRVAGKTGTAQKVGAGGYVQGRYVSSFIGFAPSNDPQVACLVVLDEPQGYPYFGGTVAAPIFKRIVEDSLHYFGVPPQEVNEKPPQIPGEEPAQPKKDVTVPDLTGDGLDQARQKLLSAGLKVLVQGEGGKVLSQIPQGGAVVSEGTEVILYTDPTTEVDVNVPDVTGMRIYEATEALEGVGLKLEPRGSGVAYLQKPAAGSALKAGSSVEVFFREGGD